VYSICHTNSKKHSSSYRATGSSASQEISSFLFCSLNFKYNQLRVFCLRDLAITQLRRQGTMSWTFLYPWWLLRDFSDSCDHDGPIFLIWPSLYYAISYKARSHTKATIAIKQNSLHRVYNNLPLVPTLKCINQVHALPSISLQDLFNILPSALSSSQCFCFFRRQPLKSCEHSFPAPYMPHAPPFYSSFSWLSE
jgi:hypothetical protein